MPSAPQELLVLEMPLLKASILELQLLSHSEEWGSTSMCWLISWIISTAFSFFPSKFDEPGFVLGAVCGLPRVRVDEHDICPSHLQPGFVLRAV